MRYLMVGLTLLAVAGCAPVGPRAALHFPGFAPGFPGYLGGGRHGTLTNTGSVTLKNVSVEVEELSGEGPVIAQATWVSVPFVPGPDFPSLTPGASTELSVPMIGPKIRNASVRADGPDGHPVSVPFTLDAVDLAPTQ